MQDIDKELESLSKEQLINVINWTRRDLNTAGQNRKLNEFVRGWCRMLLEAIEHQVKKAYNKL